MTLEYASLAAVQARIKWPGTATAQQTTALTDIVNEVNGYIEFYIGCAVGPSIETSFTLDGRDAQSGGRMIRIPGGIRTIDSLTIDGASVSLSDVYLRPKFPLPGWPYQQIWLDGQTFPDGFDNVAGTGALGFAAIPANLTGIGILTAARAWYAREAGQQDVTGSDQQGRPLVSRYISLRDRDTLDDYRKRIGIKKMAMSVAID